jgi:hypothetical protein
LINTYFINRLAIQSNLKNHSSIFTSNYRTMGLVYADIELINPFDLINAKRNILDTVEVRRMQIKIQVGNGVSSMVINEAIQSQLDLPFVEKRRFKLSDGHIIEYDVVGPIEVKFADRRTSCSAIVLPGQSEPILGSIPMLALYLIIHPKRQELIFNSDESRVAFFTRRILKLAMKSGKPI